MSLLGTYLGDIDTNGFLRGKPKDGICGLHDVTEKQYFPVGTCLDLHESRYRYGRAAEAIPYPHRGSPNLAYIPWSETGSAGNLFSARGLDVVAAHQGDKMVQVVFDDYITDNTPYNSQYKNYFQGGIAMLYNIAGDNGIIGRFRISGNEISAVHTTATQEIMRVYLDDALPYDLTPSASPATSIDLYPSPWMNQGSSANVGTRGRVTGIPLMAMISGYWGWFQTKGPSWVTPTVGITTANVNQVVFHTDGTVKVNSGDGLQTAGYMIYRGDGSADDSVLMLQLE